MRGKLGLREILLGKAGITPAHAGKTSSPARKRAGRPDHPRACGENPHHHSKRSFDMGSPPRVRGKLTFRSCLPPVSGITPACAGKTPLPELPAGLRRDHPRVCGENLGRSCPWNDISGSPPRVRGKQHSRLMLIRLLGITPACAGKTRPMWRTDTEFGDHPRVCGENGMEVCLEVRPVGSPPRVRGKLPLKHVKIRRPGITPACAGKTNLRIVYC